MRILTGQAALSKGLNITKNAVANTHAIDQLKHVKIDADLDNGVFFTATNTEIAIRTRVEAMVQESGSITVSHLLLSNIVSSLDSPQVTLYTTEGTPTVLRGKYESSKFNTPGLDPEGFPQIPEITGGLSVDLNPRDLKTALRHASISAADDTDRPILRGVNFKFDNDKLHLASADGYRLSVYHMPIDPISDPLNITIPLEAIRTVISVLSNDSERVTLHVDEDRRFAMFLTESVQIFATLLQGGYPDYNKLIPQEYETSLVIDASSLLPEIKIASVFARDVNGAIKIMTQEEDNAMSLTVDASSNGGYDNVFTCDSVTGEQGKIALRTNYLIDFLNTARMFPNATNIDLQLNGTDNPCVMRVVDNDDYAYVLMPMFVNWGE